MMCTGDICFHSTFHSEVGGGSFGGECAGQPVQQPQEAGRPFPQQCRGSDPGSSSSVLAVPVSAGAQQPEHIGHLVPAEWQRQELQGYAKFHQVLNSTLWIARHVCMLT
jgi:hypothetical protein